MARQSDIAGKLKGKRRPDNPLKTMKRLFSYYGKSKAIFIIAVIIIVVYSAATIGASYMMKPVVNMLKDTSFVPDERYAKYLALLMGMAFLYFLGALTNYIFNRLMLECSARVMRDIREHMFNHMQNMPISFFDGHTHGELMSYYTNDIDAIREMLHHSITQIIISSVSLIGIILMMIILSISLFTIIVVMGLSVFFIVKLIGKKSGKNFATQQKVVAKVNGYIEEMMEGTKVIKVFNHEEKIIEDFDKINDDLFGVATKANTYANVIGPIMNNLSHIFYAITTTVGVLTLTQGGVLIAFLQYIRQFADRMSQISSQFNFILLL